MSKHKSEDYKISAVNYYLDNDVSMDYVCNIFNCKKQSLSRWVKRYNINKSIKRNNRKSISNKITKQQVNYAIKLLKQNEQITMFKLSKQIKKKCIRINIHSQIIQNPFYLTNQPKLLLYQNLFIFTLLY